ncbi:WD40-repeat-containing domain protein [Thamnocephalis sphaerospora]|uniref:WD40-repeat-containing domain protein n=1 Tax=Thamnocephalis sphaerospora TaxID=78915 RepID=A0A4P9XW57_9FUNG|nr:WD40-repeat-containing domain protein [Thamnocephalis sphaerospora]|eukprot:RKP09831.1 WD40-repeat-containing domain protein [Thamnocephalis sphaerospora]
MPEELQPQSNFAGQTDEERAVATSASGEAQDEFVGDDDVEQVIDEAADGDVHMDDDDNDDDEEAAHEGEASGAADDMEEFEDDSVQGFFAHKEPVYAIAAHPSIPYLAASGGGDDKAYLWRSDTGEQLFELAGHTDSVTALAFSADGQYVASGGMEGKVNVWKVQTGELAVTLEGPEEVEWVTWHPKGNVVLAGAHDSTVWMWMVPSGACMNVFAGHSGSVTCGRFTHDGKGLVTGSEDGSLIIWDPKTAAATLRFTGDDARFHDEMITSLAINHDDTIVLTGSTDKSARLVHLHSGNILGALDNHTDSIETVDFCNTMPLAVTGSLDNTASIWDVTTMRLRQTVQHDGAVIRAKWLQDTPLLATCSADCTVRLWDGRSGQCERTWRGHQETVLDFALSCDGNTLVTASDDGVSLVFRRG